MLDRVLAAQDRDRTLAEAAANPDGTYHLGRLVEWLTQGLVSSAEAMWTAERLRHLMHAERKPKAEALAIVGEEAKTRPWSLADRPLMTHDGR